MQNKFFVSKLNTVLLLVLIILMVIAIRIMKQNKEMYLGVWQPEVPAEQVNIINNPKEPNYQPNPTVLPIDQSSIIAKIKATDNGPLSECKVDGKKYFMAMGMVFDGSNNVYDDKGNLLAECGGGWGIKPDPYPSICVKVVDNLSTVCASVE